VLQITAGSPPKMLGVLDTGHPVRGVAIDPKTHWLWTVWAGSNGDFIEPYRISP
jgi:hypothetical protein